MAGDRTVVLARSVCDYFPTVGIGPPSRYGLTGGTAGDRSANDRLRFRSMCSIAAVSGQAFGDHVQGNQRLDICGDLAGDYADSAGHHRTAAEEDQTAGSRPASYLN